MDPSRIIITIITVLAGRTNISLVASWSELGTVGWIRLTAQIGGGSATEIIAHKK